MKSIYMLLKQIKNILPYLALIAMYFFFVNIEATKEKKLKNNNENKYNMLREEAKSSNEVLKIKIPVIPFKE